MSHHAEIRRGGRVPQVAEAWWQWADAPLRALAPAAMEAPGWCLLLSGAMAGAVVAQWSRPLGLVAALTVWPGGYGAAGLLAWVGRELGGRASARRLAASLAVASCPLVLALAAARLAWWPAAAGLAVLAAGRAWGELGRQEAFRGGRVLALLVLAAVAAAAAAEVLGLAGLLAHRLLGIG